MASPIERVIASMVVPEIVIEDPMGVQRRTSAIFNELVIPIRGYRENVVNQHGVIFGVKGNNLVVLTPISREGVV